MIRLRYGNPIETEAVVEKIDISQQGVIPFNVTEKSFSILLKEDDIVYGLGENVRGINKRGYIYESLCADNPNHVEGTHSLYGAHNFFMVSGEKNYGVFIDTPGKVVFDIGYSKLDVLTVSYQEKDFDLYYYESETPDLVVERFRKLFGQSYIPPLWAFGYGQSRWSYMTSNEVREVVKEHRENNIPLDSVYLDIDYMERYKDFTINKEAFPDFDELVSDMKKENIHLVPIIDAGVKVEDGYSVYEEGKEKGYFCKDEEGNDFAVGVWPGKCHFPDMLNEEAGNWFGKKYSFLLEKGIDGFWNDMNEPAIFYSEQGLKETFEKIDEYKTQNLDVSSYFEFTGLVAGISNNKNDYKRFYHNYRGKKYRHDKVHNLFGYYMTRSAKKAIDELEPDKRILLFSRASYIGMHRYGGIWQGDNHSWWSHLAMNIKMMPSLNMCGFLYTGADLGGFGCDTTEDLMARWLAFGIFTPLMRNHSAMGTRRQEIYRFSNSDTLKNIVSIRYKILPYIYSEYMKAALRGKMMFRPLGFVFGNDDIARTCEDQLLVGESIMIAPVCEQNAKGRVVYFPEKMKMLKFRDGEICEEKIFDKGHHYIEVNLNEVCIYIRENKLFPLAKGGQSVEEVDFNNLELFSTCDSCEKYEYYMDDGESKEYSLEKNIKLLSL